jgi:hypothetical protein
MEDDSVAVAFLKIQHEFFRSAHYAWASTRGVASSICSRSWRNSANILVMSISEVYSTSSWTFR